MSKKQIIKPSDYEMAMMIWRERIEETGVYETVKSTPSSMYDPYLHILKYRSYLNSISVVFTLKDILGQSIFVSNGNENVKMVHWMGIILLSDLKILNHTSQI